MPKKFVSNGLQRQDLLLATHHKIQLEKPDRHDRDQGHWPLAIVQAQCTRVQRECVCNTHASVRASVRDLYGVRGAHTGRYVCLTSQL